MTWVSWRGVEIGEKIQNLLLAVQYGALAVFVIAAFMVGNTTGTQKLTDTQSGVGDSGTAAKVVDEQEPSRAATDTAARARIRETVARRPGEQRACAAAAGP